MVILKWLHSMLVRGRPELDQMGAGKSADENEKTEKTKNVKSVDIINAALVKKAEDLDDLISAGSPLIRRKKLRSKIRSKVEKAMIEELSDPSIIDEITERITDAAELDPYYENLFCKDAEQ